MCIEPGVKLNGGHYHNFVLSQHVVSIVRAIGAEFSRLIRTSGFEFW